MSQIAPKNGRQNETPSERARRLTGTLYGLLRQEIAEKGGAEEFIRWVRSDDIPRPENDITPE